MIDQDTIERLGERAPFDGLPSNTRPNPPHRGVTALAQGGRHRAGGRAGCAQR